MAVIDHGFWVQYVPAVYPFDVPPGAVFCRRESDGHDWYEYVNVIDGNEHHKHRKRRFELDSIKFVIEVEGRDESRDPIIRTAAVDASRLFPAGCRLIELTDVRREQNEGALIEEFVNRRFDLRTGRMGERWMPKPPPDKFTPRLEAMEARIAKLELIIAKFEGMKDV